tara:strand:- start:131 stop:1327 length:1197 start_codon:yes stop_codon:yes gene_type:complete
MKANATLMTLLMITTALAGCAGEESISEELGGTTWVTIEESPGPGFLDWTSISVITFNEDGTLEEAYFAHNQDGCDETLGLVPSEEDPSLCFKTMDMFGSGDSSEDSMTWDITEDGTLIVTQSMSFTGDGVDENFCDEMREYGFDTHDYSTTAVVSWEGESGICDISLRQWGKLILGDGTLVSHPLHRVTEGNSSDIACTLGVPWTGQDQASIGWLVHEELLSLCPEPVPVGTAVWECRIEVPLNGLDAEAYRESVEQHPGYPEWCGSPVPAGMDVENPGSNFLDDSEPRISPAEDVYGSADEWGKWGRNETHFLGSWPGPEECNTMTIYDIFNWIDWPDNRPEGEVGQWDEEASLCATPVPCESEIDSRFIYEGCWPSPYAQYHWTGDYLYIGQISE